MKKRILSCLLCLAVLATALLTSACGKAKLTPEEKLTQSLENAMLTATASAKEFTALPSLEQVAKSGSVEIEVQDLKNEAVSALTAKIFLNGSSTAAELQVQNAVGEPFGGKAWLNQQAFVAESQSLLGGAYGINLSSFGEDLVRFLAKNPALLGKLDFGTILFYTNSLRQVQQVMEAAGNLSRPDDAEKWTSFFKNVVLKTLLENATVTETKQTVSSLDKNLSATCLSVSLSNEALAKVLEASNAFLQSDEELRARLASLFPLLQSTLTEGAAFPWQSAEDFLAVLNTQVADLAEQIRTAEEINGQFSIFLNSKNAIVRAEITVACNGTTAAVTLDLDENPNAFEEAQLSVKVTGQEKEPQEANAHLKIEGVDGGKKASFELWGSAVNGFDRVEGSFTCRAVGKTELTVTMPTESPIPERSTKTVTASFEHQKEGDADVYQNFSFTMDEGENLLPAVKVTVRATDAFPAIPEYTSFFELTPEQAEELKTKLDAFLAPFGDFEEQEEDSEIPPETDLPVLSLIDAILEAIGSAGQSEEPSLADLWGDNLLEPDFK